MYIELFVLDNLVMNLLVLRLAGAICGRPCAIWRTLLAAALGALYACATLEVGFASHWLFRVLCAGLMSLSIPGSREWKLLLCAWASVLLSACMIGGLLLLFSFLPDASTDGVYRSISWRCALWGAAVAAFLPKLWRKRRGWQKPRKLCVAFEGEVYTLPARIDTGNVLREPISDRPVIVAHIQALKGKASIPIPAATVQGGVMLYAIKADYITLDGIPSDALLALSDYPLREALIPPAAISF